MNLNLGQPVETKVAAGGLVGLGVTLITQLLAIYAPHLTLPTPATMGLITTFLTVLAGYIAPHTSRPVPPQLPPVSPLEPGLPQV